MFRLTSGKEMRFECKVKLNDVDEADMFMGMTTSFATNPEEALTAADRVGFQVLDGDASITCITEKDGTETSTDSGKDLVDATYSKLGFFYDGASKVEFFVDDILVASHTANLPDDENLTMVGFVLSGAAAATILTIDYMAGDQER
jgi:hypothetical protein